MNKVNSVGFTKLLHLPDLENKESVWELKGVPLSVFENFGKEIITSELDCSKEIFEILSFKLSKYGDEKLKRQWVDFTKELIVKNNLDLSDEFHELMTFHYSRLNWRGQGEMILRYLGKDTLFTFKPLNSEK